MGAAGGLLTVARGRRSQGRQEFMDELHKIVMENGLLSPGGIMLCDNVLYRGLPAQLEAGSAPAVSAKTQANAEALMRFNDLVKADMEGGVARALMMPVREGRSGRSG